MFIKCSRSELTVHWVTPRDIMMVTSALVTPMAPQLLTLHPDNLELFGFVASDKAFQHHLLSPKFSPKKPILPHLSILSTLTSLRRKHD